MPESRHQVPAGRVSAACALLLAIAALVELLTVDVGHDAASFGAGYTAASNRELIRHAMGVPGATPAGICLRLFESDSATDRLIRGDFVDGCTRAVGDVME